MRDIYSVNIFSKIDCCAILWMFEEKYSSSLILQRHYLSAEVFLVLEISFSGAVNLFYWKKGLVQLIRSFHHAGCAINLPQTESYRELKLWLILVVILLNNPIPFVFIIKIRGKMQYVFWLISLKAVLIEFSISNIPNKMYHSTQQILVSSSADILTLLCCRVGEVGSLAMLNSRKTGNI